MVDRWWKNNGCICCCAIGTTCLFALYLILRQTFLIHIPVWYTWLVDLSVFVLLIAGLSTVLGTQLPKRTQRALTHLLGRAHSLRVNPGRRQQSGLPQFQTQQLTDVETELDLLGESYSNALTKIVKLEERVEEYETAAGRGSEKTFEANSTRLAPSRHVGGSSRHRMVARLAPNLHWLTTTVPLIEFLGYATKELIARSFLEVVHPDDAAKLRKTLGKVLKRGEGHNLQFRVRVLDNSGNPSRKARSTNGAVNTFKISTRYVQMDVLTCYYDNGEPQYLRCHILDITERARIEKQLRERDQELEQTNQRLLHLSADLDRLKESYSDLYHYSPVMYFSLDSSSNLVGINETMLTTLGYTREALLGKPYLELLPEPLKQAFDADPGTIRLGGDVEMQWAKADGTTLYVSITSKIVRDEHGKFLKSRCVALDITERKKLAKALTASRKELDELKHRLQATDEEPSETDTADA